MRCLSDGGRMRVLRTILVMLLFSTMAAAQENGGVVSGTVSRRDNGEPISGARISLSSQLGAVTDNEGKFTIERIPPDTYNVSVQGDGYVLSQSESATPSFLESVLPGGSLATGAAPIAQDAGRLVILPSTRITDFRVRMVPSGTVTGRVLRSDGAPDADA